MSILEHDKLVELEEVLDWQAARVLPEIVADPDAMKELEEAELFRAAMEGESTPRQGFIDEVMAALPSDSKSESGYPWLVVLNGIAAAAACFLAFLSQLGLESTSGESSASVAAMIPVAFGVGWGRVSQTKLGSRRPPGDAHAG